MLLFWLTGSTVEAAPILDQVAVGVDYGGQLLSFAGPVSQPFTVGVDGVLDSIGVGVFQTFDPGPTPDLTFDLQFGNVTLLHALISELILPVEQIPGFAIVAPLTFVNVASAQIPVRIGETYQIVLTQPIAPTGLERWAIWNRNSTGTSFAFATFVEPSPAVVPEPTTAVLLLLGLAGAAMRCRRSKRPS